MCHWRLEREKSNGRFIPLNEIHPYQISHLITWLVHWDRWNFGSFNLTKTNPQKEKKLIIKNRRDLLLVLSPFRPWLFILLIGLVGLACVNEVFYLPLFLSIPLSSFLLQTHRESLRKNTLVFKDFFFFFFLKYVDLGGGRVCVWCWWILFSLSFISFSREELLKPMGLKPDGTITPLEEALNQYSVIEETSSDTDWKRHLLNSPYCFYQHLFSVAPGESFL